MTYKREGRLGDGSMHAVEELEHDGLARLWTGGIRIRAAPLVRAKVKITVKNAVCPSLPIAAYGVFDCEFGFPSHEWSCS